jgi:hypothetical protein
MTAIAPVFAADYSHCVSNCYEYARILSGLASEGGAKQDELAEVATFLHHTAEMLRHRAPPALPVPADAAHPFAEVRALARTYPAPAPEAPPPTISDRLVTWNVI